MPMLLLPDLPWSHFCVRHTVWSIIWAVSPAEMLRAHSGAHMFWQIATPTCLGAPRNACVVMLAGGAVF